MTKQAQNCIGLLSGHSEEKILQTLSFLSSSVIDELKEYFNVSSKQELATILSQM